jgi:hypothetical protein
MFKSKFITNVFVVLTFVAAILAFYLAAFSNIG